MKDEITIQDGLRIIIEDELRITVEKLFEDLKKAYESEKNAITEKELEFYRGVSDGISKSISNVQQSQMKILQKFYL